MTITLDFDGQAVALTPAESRSVLREMDLIRRRIEDGGDPQPLLATLRRQVQQSISEHVRFVQPDEVEVTIEQEACRITTRRLPRSRH